MLDFGPHGHLVLIVLEGKNNHLIIRNKDGKPLIDVLDVFYFCLIYRIDDCTWWDCMD